MTSRQETDTASVIPSGTGRRRAFQIGTVVAAIGAAALASICCVGPIFIAIAGVGSYGFVARMDAYRPLFILVTLGLLAAGFYLSYGRRRAGAGGATACGEDCARPRLRRAGRIALWASAVLVLALLAFPYFAPWVEPYLARMLLE
jgi:mercuric ion transport protein